MKISIHSGLGNQLFQFAFFHFLIHHLELNQKIKVVPEYNARLDRKFQLQELIAFCDHSRNNKNIFSKHIYSQYFIDFISKFFYFSEIKELTFLDDEYNSLSRFSQLNGYFQHWKYVDYSYYLFAAELNDYLNTINIENNIVPKSFIGLHVRRGDNIYTLDTMGSLSYRYYLKVLEKENTLGLPVVLFTDDLKGASDVVEKVSPDYCFGPKDLSVWQTLKLMSNSHSLITANSTLSWWAALIGFKSGRIKKVIIPDPWFRNWPTKILDSFHYPGFQISSANFIEAHRFITDYELPGK